MTNILYSNYDVFLSHSHNDSEKVAIIARILEDHHNVKVWLDKWILIPGKPFIQDMSKGLEEAKTCAVIVGNETPKGWFKEEINKALSRQTKDENFRVIPVLLPGSNVAFINDFLELRTWVTFKSAIDEKRPLHELKCGIQGIAPGRFFEDIDYDPETGNDLEIKLKTIKKLHDNKLIDSNVNIEYQRIILNNFLLGRK